MRTRPRPSQSACTQATFGSPRENQLRALAVLEHVVGSGGEIFTFARGRMLRRWERLEALFASLPEAGQPEAGQEAALFSLEPRDAPATDAFSGEVEYAPSPAYAWIKLNSAEAFGGDALAAMAAYGIVGRSGREFGAEPCHVRLELLMREQTFELLIAKLEELLRAGRQ